MASKYGIYLREKKGEYYVSHNGKKLYLGTARNGIKAAEAKYRKIIGEEAAGIDDTPSGLTVSRLCETFLSSKRAEASRGDISPITLDHLERTCRLIVDAMGRRKLCDLKGLDFTGLRNSMPGDWGTHNIAGNVRRIRQVFKFGYDNDLCPPIKFGELKVPSKRVSRGERNKQEHRVWTAKQINQLLTVCTPTDRAIVLLGVHCGMTLADCGRLERDMISGNQLTQLRLKSNVVRVAHLSSSVLEAVTEADSGLDGPMLRTQAGNPVWATNGSYFSSRLGRLKQRAGIKESVTHHGLRRTFYSVATKCPNVPVSVIKGIMAHTPEDVGAEHYQTSIDHNAIAKVSDYMDLWLNNERDFSEFSYVMSSPEEISKSDQDRIVDMLRKKHPCLR